MGDQGIATEKITEELLDTIVSPDTKGDGTGCDNMTIVIVKIDQEKTKFLTNIKNDEKVQNFNTEQHIVEEEEGTTPMSMHGTPYSKDDPENVNMCDGSAKILGKMIEHKVFRDHDYDFSNTDNLWTVEKIIQDDTTSPVKSERSDKENVQPDLEKTVDKENIEGQPPAKRARQSEV